MNIEIVCSIPPPDYKCLSSQGQVNRYKHCTHWCWHERKGIPYREGFEAHKVLATKHKDPSLFPHKVGLACGFSSGEAKKSGSLGKKEQKEGREGENKEECVTFISFILVIFKFLSSFNFLQSFCYLRQIHEWSCPSKAIRFFRG